MVYKIKTVAVSVRVKDHKAESVSFQNVPSFLYQSDVRVRVPGRAPITADISYGGNFFAMVDADALGLVIEPGNSLEIIRTGMDILQDLQKSKAITHPLTGEQNRVRLVEFHTSQHSPGVHARNTVVFGSGQLDRSPCGTGTCARMAHLYAKGVLGLHETFIHESIIGTRFAGRLLDTVKMGEFLAVIPEITANAFITGIHEFHLQLADPLKNGFQL